jgi:UDP-N-acetylglucosamine 2-epimerase (non-hydrolysing)
MGLSLIQCVKSRFGITVLKNMFCAKMNPIMVILGTRPEAIKLAPVILQLKASDMPTVVCVTAQHRGMLDQALAVFDIKPDIDLDLMSRDQSLTLFASKALAAIDAQLDTIKPRMVLVHGDTTTALCAALAAFHRHIPVGHVEAGLRTGLIQNPWPEEANRIMIDRLATLHFAPTMANLVNLRQEFLVNNHVTGNTVVDAVRLAKDKIKENPPEITKWAHFQEPLVLVTSHRRESFGEGFVNICKAVRRLAVVFLPKFHFVYSVHQNPNVENIVEGFNWPHNVHLFKPFDYLSFLALMDQATLILTDSGGVQEEAACLGKRTIVMRVTTERIELVESGAVRLTGTDPEQIVSEALHQLQHVATTFPVSPYGDGHAAEKIVEAIQHFYA